VNPPVSRRGKWATEAPGKQHKWPVLALHAFSREWRSVRALVRGRRQIRNPRTVPTDPTRSGLADGCCPHQSVVPPPALLTRHGLLAVVLDDMWPVPVSDPTRHWLSWRASEVLDVGCRRGKKFWQATIWRGKLTPSMATDGVPLAPATWLFSLSPSRFIHFAHLGHVYFPKNFKISRQHRMFGIKCRRKKLIFAN
jgi:hypothetical protein